LGRVRACREGKKTDQFFGWKKAWNFNFERGGALTRRKIKERLKPVGSFQIDIGRGGLARSTHLFEEKKGRSIGRSREEKKKQKGLKRGTGIPPRTTESWVLPPPKKKANHGPFGSNSAAKGG